MGMSPAESLQASSPEKEGVKWLGAVGGKRGGGI